MGHADRVRRARDLERPVGAGALGHEVLDGLGDVAVVLAEDKPRRLLLPQRVIAGGLDERLLGGRPLRGTHPPRARRWDIRGELLVEALLNDRQVVRAVAARYGLQ